MGSVKLKSVLEQPHPRSSGKRALWIAAIFGVVITMFLAIFQPFGLYLVENSLAKFIILAGYGLITFVVVAVNGVVLPLLFPRFYAEGSWTFGKSLLFEGIGNFLWVGIGNFFYSALAFRYEISFRNFIFFQLVTLSVGLLPYIVLLTINHVRLLKLYGTAANELNTELDEYAGEMHAEAAEEAVTLVSDGGYDTMELKASSFIMAESADNYVKLRYSDYGTTKTKILRLTLKKLEEYFDRFGHIVRCHRKYMVNIHCVTSFSGNAQGLKLKLADDTENHIPVSRAMVSTIKTLLSTPDTATIVADRPKNMQPDPEN